MKTSAKLLSLFLFLAGAATAGFSAQERAALLEQFEFQGRNYRIYDDLSGHAAGLTLKGRASVALSAGMAGENILLGTRAGSGNFYIFWLNYRQGALRLAFYDHGRGRSRLLPLAGFSFIGLPEVIEENNILQGLVFLGNNSNNDDIFYYEPKKDLLTALTATPFSEKGFTLLEKDGRLEIGTRSLWARFRYAYDRRLRKSELLEKTHFSAGQRAGAAAVAPEYFNTYIGFGDSITWGEIEGVQRLDVCYLTQMRELLADPGYVDYYGASSPINLGVPGDSTLSGAERVDEELVAHEGFYFLLMLGVNDVFRSDLSIDSSLENLGYIIDAAKAKGMRVIVSTPTPSKARYTAHPYYWTNLNGLSAGIMALALEKNIASIDSLAQFMNTNPPDGWKDLLENVIPDISSGNHPNEAGHRVIASLFSAALVKFPPLPPHNITVVDPGNALHRTASWSVNYESDFSHFHVVFGFQPEALDYSLDTAASYCTFNLFPFLPQLYFHIQAVDRGARQSAAVIPAATTGARGQRPLKIK